METVGFIGLGTIGGVVAGNIRKEALPEATARIADEIEKLIPPIP